MMKTTDLIRQIRLGRLRRSLRRLRFSYRLRTAGKRALPDFLILGAMKAGTSSLSKYLQQHPRVHASPLGKWGRVHFFDAKHVPGSDLAGAEVWYRAHFPRVDELEPQSRVFDATPNYLFEPLAPRRIHDMLPQMKLIALLRNPTERAISHYSMSRRRGHESLGMLEAFQQEEARQEHALTEQAHSGTFLFAQTYKSRGRYAEQLERYLLLFPREGILILISEEFFADPRSTLRRVYEFIDVDAGFAVSDLTPVNVGRGRQPVPPEARQYLDGYFKPFNRMLSDLLGRELPW